MVTERVKASGISLGTRFSNLKGEVVKWQRMYVLAATSLTLDGNVHVRPCKYKSIWQESPVPSSIGYCPISTGSVLISISEGR